VDRLVSFAAGLPRRFVPLSQLGELDEAWCGDNERPTWRALVGHIKLIEEADLSFPIILSSSGAIMDGRHRLAKAALLGRTEIEAVRFQQDPEPDYVGRGPDELPY